MGRITVFTMDHSPNCLLVQKELIDRDIPFTEISLTKYPQKRNDMLSLSDKLTVPQVFINTAFVGGYGSTVKILKGWEENGKSPLDTYESLVANANDPTDPRLQPSDQPPASPSEMPPRNTNVITLPSSTSGAEQAPNRISVLEMTEILKTIVPRKDLKYNMTTYRKSFRASAFVTALMEHFLIDRKTAIEFSRRLQKDHQMLNHVVKEHEFEDTSTLFFRLQCDQTPNVLNSYRVWTERVDPDAMSLLRRLKRQLHKVIKDNVDLDGKVYYKHAASHRDFAAFEEAVCELQGVNYSHMPFNTKLAFSMNLYNLMIKYANIKVGIPVSAMDRTSFFNTVSFNIGGYIITFQDMEQGILRGNKKAPHGSSRQFKENDKRLGLAMTRPDIRIHFGLNCGAKSCPKIVDFTAYGVQEELRIAAQEFCEDNSNVQVDGDMVHLSKIFHWYSEDFGSDTAGVVETIAGFCKASKRAELKNLLSGGSLKVKYNSYDWSTDASDFATFHADTAKADVSRFRG
ncbi:MAG: hypothetical protein SGILL_005935 [Bacillariaceae sp.]